MIKLLFECFDILYNKILRVWQNCIAFMDNLYFYLLKNLNQNKDSFSL